MASGHLALRLLLAGLFALGSGCSGKKPPQDPFIQEWQEKAAHSKPIMPDRREFEASALATQAATPPTSTPPPETRKDSGDQAVEFQELPSELISVRFINEELPTVLRTLARLAKQNIIISPNVKGMVNTHIEDTPWNDVFLGLTKGYGLTVIKDKELLRIMSQEDLKQQVEKSTLLKEKQQVAPLFTKVIVIEFSNPPEIAKSIEPLLSKDKDGKPRGSVAVDTHSRSLIIQDVEQNLNKMAEMVYELDKSTPQIQIEAHIVETTKNMARELGIQWGAFANNLAGDSRLSLNPGGPGGALTVGKSPTGDQYLLGRTYIPGVNGTEMAAGTGLFGHGTGVDLGANAIGGINPAKIGLLVSGKDYLLDAQLSALQQDGKINILSRPSISTLDNIEAVIESGTEVPFETTSQTGTTVAYKNATLSLTVTPHVINDKMIKLNIIAIKNEVDSTRTVKGNPYIIKKKATTQLIVENGATVVIAGLSKEQHITGDTGVPFLKDLPLLGYLFKKDSTAENFEEVLIFITPKILTKSAEAASAAAPNQE